MKEPTVMIPMDVADQIVHDTLVFYRELLSTEIKQLKKKRKPTEAQLQDLGRDIHLVDAMDALIDYFQPSR